MKPMFVSGLFIPSHICAHENVGPGPKLVWVCLEMCRRNDQASISQDDVAQLLGTTGRQVRRWLGELQQAGLILEVERDRTTKLNVYRFGSIHHSDIPDSLSCEPLNSEKRDAPKKKRKATRLDPGWIPDSEIHIWAKDNYPALDSHYEFEKFRDYWCSRSGGSAIKVDWNLAFRNWIRKANEYRARDERRDGTFEQGLAAAADGGVVSSDEGSVW